MQDEYTGQPGTYIVDPDKGIRIPIEQYEAEQAAKSSKPAPARPIPDVEDK